MEDQIVNYGCMHRIKFLPFALALYQPIYNLYAFCRIFYIIRQQVAKIAFCAPGSQYLTTSDRIGYKWVDKLRVLNRIFIF